jgi:hypothetical protein
MPLAPTRLIVAKVIESFLASDVRRKRPRQFAHHTNRFALRHPFSTLNAQNLHFRQAATTTRARAGTASNTSGTTRSQGQQ